MADLEQNSDEISQIHKDSHLLLDQQFNLLIDTYIVTSTEVLDFNDSDMVYSMHGKYVSQASLKLIL